MYRYVNYYTITIFQIAISTLSFFQCIALHSIQELASSIRNSNSSVPLNLIAFKLHTIVLHLLNEHEFQRTVYVVTPNHVKLISAHHAIQNELQPT